MPRQMPSSDFHLAARALPPAPTEGLFTDADLDLQRAFFAADPELRPTPLAEAPALAAELGLGGLWMKDETARFGLPAFKALGARFAVGMLVRQGRAAPGTTLVCASEGNHGRAVARAARAHGLTARVYVGAAVARSRADAIRAEGAEVVRVDGTYDDAVRRAAAHAGEPGWLVVSDTGWPGHDEIPRLVMLGYTRLMDECAAQWRGRPPELMCVQAGVGGLAGAVASWWARWRAEPRPRLLCVEPLGSACVLASARRGAPVRIEAARDTIMAGLCCGEASTTALPAVTAGFDAYVALDDEWARAAVRRLAVPAGADPRIAAGPSGAAGLAALLALRHDPALRPLRDALGLERPLRALIVITEGPTEPELFAAITSVR